MHCMTRWAVGVGLILTAAAFASAQNTARGWYDVDLRLEGALWVPGDGEVSLKNQPADLLLHLGVRDGTWRDYVIGWSGEHRNDDGLVTPSERQHNQMDHEGDLKATSDANGTVVLTTHMTIHDDPWVRGGKATYRIRISQDGNSFSGTFNGVYRGRKVDGKVTGERMGYLWPAPVEGVKPSKPNEHPRLLFRRSDLRALRARMKTPQGKAILARLRKTLGGENMPTHFSRAKRAYGDGGGNLPMGAYTLWHGMGFGFLYQLTGEQKYADLAKRCVDKALDGTRDRDQRYAWVRPGGKLRAGSSYAAIAMAYDLCYDAWDKDYRTKLARKIQDKVWVPGEIDRRRKALKEPVDVGLVFKTGGGQHSPWSNHYGAWNGGGGSAILAILGDDGTDDEITTRAYRVFLRRAKRALRVGYGDAAWFFEGHHGGRLSSNTGLVTYINHLRTSQGLDLVAQRPEAQWLAGKHVFEIVRQGGKLAIPEQGIYANGRFERGGMSTGGDFARGFGVAPGWQKPAILWFFNHVIEPGDSKTYDAIRYPHHAVFAYLYWPTDVKEKNPAKVMGKWLRDRKAQYTVFRSGWSKSDDDVIAAVERGTARIVGMGLKKSVGVAGGRAKSFRKIGPDTCAVDYGKDTLVADMDGPGGSPMTLVSIRGVQSGKVTVKADRKLSAAEKAFIEKLRQSARRRRENKRNNPPADPKPLKKGQAGVVERVRYLGSAKCEIVTVGRGPAPEAVVEGKEDDQCLRIGRLIISIKDETVVVTIDKVDKALPDETGRAD
ncbi:MAG: hypothetical protein ACLFVY_07270 [Phycisphaerae bacterium]